MTKKHNQGKDYCSKHQLFHGSKYKSCKIVKVFSNQGKQAGRKTPHYKGTAGRNKDMDNTSQCIEPSVVNSQPALLKSQDSVRDKKQEKGRPLGEVTSEGTRQKSKDASPALTIMTAGEIWTKLMKTDRWNLVVIGGKISERVPNPEHDEFAKEKFIKLSEHERIVEELNKLAHEGSKTMLEIQENNFQALIEEFRKELKERYNYEGSKNILRVIEEKIDKILLRR